MAVVLPTLTWQAYNFRDDGRDGHAGSWYVDKRVDAVQLGQAFLDRGVPYGFRNLLGFLNWLHWTRRRPTTSRSGTSNGPRARLHWKMRTTSSSSPGTTST